MSEYTQLRWRVSSRDTADSRGAASHTCKDMSQSFLAWLLWDLGQSRQHLWLQSFQLLDVRLAQVPVLINITWTREAQSWGFGSAILRWWQCRTSCSILRCGKKLAANNSARDPNQMIIFSLPSRKIPLENQSLEISSISDSSFIFCSKHFTSDQLWTFSPPVFHFFAFIKVWWDDDYLNVWKLDFLSIGEKNCF